MRGVELPLINLDGVTKDGVAILNLKDLSKFAWPETGATYEPRNQSN